MKFIFLKQYENGPNHGTSVNSSLVHLPSESESGDK